MAASPWLAFIGGSEACLKIRIIKHEVVPNKRIRNIGQSDNSRRVSRMEYYVRNSEGGFVGEPHPTLEEAQGAARAAKELTGEDYSVSEIRFVWSTKDA